MNPEARPPAPDDRDSVVNEWSTKGFKATIGLDETRGDHVVMNVLYDKNKHSIEDVVKYVNQTKSCSRCSALNKDRLNIESIQLGGSEISAGPSGPASGFATRAARAAQVGSGDESSAFPSSSAPVPVAPAKKPLDVKNLFADMFFKAYLTGPGMYFMASMLGDDGLMEQAMSGRGEVAFMDEMLAFMSGDLDLMRSPEEAREVLSAMRASTDNTSTAQAARKKKKVFAAQSVLVY